MIRRPALKRQVWLPPLLLFIASCGLAAVILTFLAERQQDLIRAQLDARRQAAINALQIAVTDQLNSASRRILYIANSRVMRDHVCDASDRNRQALESAMNDLIAAPDVFMSQLRYIDQNGTERVRLNRDTVDSRPASQLQNKSGRYYFQRTTKLRAGDLYVSRPDLNEEFGEIVTPIEPTLRIATPVPTCDGSENGIAVANIRLRDWVRALKTVEQRMASRLAIEPPDGSWRLDREGVNRQAPRDPGNAIQAPRDESPQPMTKRVLIFQESLLGGLHALEIFEEQGLQLLAETPQQQWIAAHEDSRKDIVANAAALIGAFAIFSLAFLWSRILASGASAKVELHQDVIDRMPDALLVVDEDGKIRGSNVAAAEAFGYAQKDFAKVTIEHLVGGGAEHEHHLMRSTFFAGELGHVVGAGREVSARDRDGHAFSVVITLSAPFTHAGKRMTLAVIQVPSGTTGR